MKNGFTLVELLAILIVIGVLSLIIVPVMGTIIEDKEQKLYDVQINEIKASAELWLQANAKFLTRFDKGKYMYIYTGHLKLAGFISKDLKSPIDNACVSNYIPIQVASYGDGYDIKVLMSDIEEPEDADNCNYPDEIEFRKFGLYGDTLINLKKGDEFVEPGWFIIKDGMVEDNPSLVKEITAYKNDVGTTVSSIDSTLDVDYFNITYEYNDGITSTHYLGFRKINLVV